ncbi:mannose-6-phosphate isomerase, class I [Microbacterium sp. C7(2022)]|uniref:mannose-6-phosphate isomerase, class I n=1 Tax=Microbacterium sp. C7(2022) TaxID=2992759 RepID=UPI00237C42F3|nr:mannose-6-phosphate isomerase, class I [Microbacterium sp. C7(2022)]MDE0547498.1 mannose-6-phosphate isomerase, class I [Microbacterium sp. C7(2022)]
MFIALTNTPRDYAWGSTTAIAEFRGVEPSGAPEAELWLGTHPGSPTHTGTVVPELRRTHDTLQEWIAAEPARLLGEAIGAQRNDLPILLKVLAAASPLSLQVHPTPEQATAGFAAEEARGIPISDPSRNYKDPFPKPEIIVAVSERFDALCGFRPADEVAALIDTLRESGDDAFTRLVEILADPTRVQDALTWLLAGGPAVTATVDALTALASRDNVTDAALATTWQTVREVSQHYPGDPGVVVAALMNRVSLRRGEGLYAPAGLLHAYLSGLGIELMTASDNVVRGGLTPKHIDTDELVRLLSFDQGPATLLTPEVDGAVTGYTPPAPFSMLLVDGDAVVTPTGPAIVLADSDAVTVEDSAGVSMTIPRGDAAFVSGDVTSLRVSGPGRAWVAMAQA